MLQIPINITTLETTYTKVKADYSKKLQNGNFLKIDAILLFCVAVTAYNIPFR
jgi:hypothetical protein